VNVRAAGDGEAHFVTGAGGKRARRARGSREQQKDVSGRRTMHQFTPRRQLPRTPQFLKPPGDPFLQGLPRRKWTGPSEVWGMVVVMAMAVAGGHRGADLRAEMRRGHE